MSKAIDVELKCPGCGKTINVRVVKVVDEPAVPAEAHYVAEVVRAGKGGLFDGNQGSEEDKA